MTDSDTSLPEATAERRSLADDLCDRASDEPSAFTPGEMEQVVALLGADDPGVRVTAAECLQHLYDRPSLFEPVLGELLAASSEYPPDVEGIPAPVTWMGDEDVRTAVYVADSLARVAQRRPELFAPVVDQLTEAALGDANAPRHHLFTLGLVGAAHPERVPLDRVKADLCSLLDRGRGNGFPGWAARTLAEIGHPDVLDALRANYPAEAADDGAREAFDEAIAELESG